jgi:hypothetical protein
VKISTLVPDSLGIINVGSHGDAHEDILSCTVVRGAVMDIICCDKSQSKLSGDSLATGVKVLLVGKGMGLYLQVISVFEYASVGVSDF